MDTPSSCISKEPFIKLGDGQAPILNYNLPQETCFNVYGRLPLSVPQKYFRGECFKPPAGNFWEENKRRRESDIADELNDLAAHGVPYSSLGHALGAVRGKLTTTGNAGAVGGAKSKAQAASAALREPIAKGALSVAALARRIAGGLRPVPYRSFGGEYRLEYAQEPVKPSPRLFAVETMTVCSYLGDYGAGKTLNVMSLLPGEKTQISIKTYLDKESTNSASQNVLDSFSESSADELEHLLKDETGESASTTRNTGYSLSLSQTLSVTIPVKAVDVGVDASAAAGFKHDKTKTTATNASHIDQTIDKHVQNTSHTREVMVNVTHTESVKSGEETATVRNLENINRSRVLNIVFRQLLQKYVTLIALTDVRIVYTNGYPESTVIMGIHELDEKLKDLLAPEKIAEVRDAIVKEYCLVYNYAGVAKHFLEKVAQDYKDCDCLHLAERREFCRIDKSLADASEGFHVNGVILAVRKHVLKTPAVIADALLGQGEALDCYNMQLQQAATEAAHLANRKVQKALDIIDQIADGAEKAAAYARMLAPHTDAAANDSDSV